MTNKPERHDRCGTCKFFHHTDVQQGECRIRRKHVTTFVLPSKMGQLEMPSISVFPTCKTSEWCGEWQPKIETKVQ